MRALSLVALVALSACVSPAMIQYRAELREMRATADRLCEERGGLEVFQPIPEMMDVLTVFEHAGEYRGVPGVVDPNPHFGGMHNYKMYHPVPKEHMARLTLPTRSDAYIVAHHHLSTGRVGAVELLVEDFQSYKNRMRPEFPHDGMILPDRSEPSGMYRYEIVEAGHPACTAFDEMMAEFQQRPRYGYRPRVEFDEAIYRNGKCIAITYRGPKETYVPPRYIHQTYDDDLPEQKLSQDIEELIAPDGKIIARLRHFMPVTRLGSCDGKPTNILNPHVYAQGEVNAD